jgi:hypothetical protein
MDGMSRMMMANPSNGLFHASGGTLQFEKKEQPRYNNMK